MDTDKKPIHMDLHLDLPKNAHPKLVDLMQRCWETALDKRPSFFEIKAELDTLQLNLRLFLKNLRSTFKIINVVDDE
ncbi:hypothetical protein PTKIN_Ptkin15bG0091800 [Pterospermum kingtungense]